MAEVDRPTSFGFTEKDIMDDAREETLPLGQWYRFRIADCQYKLSQKGKNPGSHMFNWRLRALADPNDPNGDVFGPTAWHNLTVPVQNPDVPGHKKPRTMGLVISAIRAIFPDEIPDMPEKDEDGVWVYNGDAIDSDSVEESKEEVRALVRDKLDEILEDTSICVDRCFYAYYQKTKDKAGDEWVNVMYCTFEPQPDKKTGEMPTIATADDTDYSATPEKPKGGNGATGRAKPAKRKKAKKKARRK
jgi:hypothetical protein